MVFRVGIDAAVVFPSFTFRVGAGTRVMVLGLARVWRVALCLGVTLVGRAVAIDGLVGSSLVIRCGAVRSFLARVGIVRVDRIGIARVERVISVTPTVLSARVVRVGTGLFAVRLGTGFVEPRVGSSLASVARVIALGVRVGIVSCCFVIRVGTCFVARV